MARSVMGTDQDMQWKKNVQDIDGEVLCGKD
jgi:hypothetical protein